MTPLYQRLLGDRYTVLPPEVQALHDVRGTLVAEGRASVRRGWGLGGLLAAVLSLPPEGEDQPVRVTFTADGDREIWTRRFGDRVFRSVQWLQDGCVVERLPLGGGASGIPRARGPGRADAGACGGAGVRDPADTPVTA